MKSNIVTIIIILAILIGIAVYANKPETAPAPEGTNITATSTTPAVASQDMSFFITSSNPGRGGDLGGLVGADAYCTQLAESAGVSGKTWRAYLSATTASSSIKINARDRIGKGPWYNFKGDLIAVDVTALHGVNGINKETALTEKGNIVSGRGDAVNIHDMLTGSDAMGMASSTKNGDTTCGNWTLSASSSAIVGHHDRVGRDESEPMKSWVSSHATQGCSLEQLKTTGGAGLFYCFAAN